MVRPLGIPSRNKGKSFEEIFGIERSKEISLKISNSLKGRIAWNKGLTVETDLRVARNSQNNPRNKGKHHTEKWKENMSEKMQGRSITWGAKISKAKTGITFSCEHKDKLKEAKRLNIHDQFVLQNCVEFEKEGCRCIPILKSSPQPDIIIIKDSKIYAVENVHYYDDIIWIIYSKRGGKNELPKVRKQKCG